MSRADALDNRKLALRLLKDCISSMGIKYVIFVAIIIAIAVINLAPPQLYRMFFQATSSGENQAIKKIIVFGIIISVCSFITAAISIYAREWLRCAIETHLRKSVLSALTMSSLSRLENLNRGEWMTCTSGDLVQTEDFLTLSFPDQLKNLLMFIGVMCLFCYQDLIFGASLFFLAVVLIFFNIFVQRKIEPKLNEIRLLHGRVYQHLLENFEGLRTIRSFSGEPMVRENFQNRLSEINQKSLRAIFAFAILIGTNEFFILLGITTTLGLILYQLNLGRMSFDAAITYPFYMGVFFMSVTSFYRSNFDWMMFFTKGARLARVLYDGENLKHPPITVTKEHQSIDKMVFKQIDLRYEGHQPLLRPFDLTVKNYEVLGIIGPSGSGKSTLLEFLAGLRPLEVFGKKTLLNPKLTAYVEQKPYIFEGTLADNLRFGCNALAHDNDMWSVLERLRLTDFFHARQGLMFPIKERGQNLSEGEKYRIAVARAVLSNKPFLLLDEPFASLDHDSILWLIQLFNEERRYRGLVIVTHYLPAELAFDALLDFTLLKKDNRRSVCKPVISHIGHASGA